MVALVFTAIIIKCTLATPIKKLDNLCDALGINLPKTYAAFGALTYEEII